MSDLREMPSSLNDACRKLELAYAEIDALKEADYFTLYMRAEEQIVELRRLVERLTAENEALRNVPRMASQPCKHQRRSGSGSIGTGGYKMTWYCQDCGATGSEEYPAALPAFSSDNST